MNGTPGPKENKSTELTFFSYTRTRLFSENIELPGLRGVSRGAANNGFAHNLNRTKHTCLPKELRVDTGQGKTLTLRT